MSLKLELPDGTRVPLTLHALERWQEYICPLAPLSEAIALLARFVDENGTVTAERPEWIREGNATLWVVAGDFCLPVVVPRDGSPYDGFTYFIPTFIARGTITPDERLARRHERRTRASRTRGRSRKQGDRRTGASAHRRIARAPDVDQWT